MKYDQQEKLNKKKKKKMYLPCIKT